MFRGFDAARFLKSALEELLFGNENVDIETRIRNDNSSVVAHVHSIGPIAKERGFDGFLERNREDLGANPWLALSHIMRPLNISGELAKSTTRMKLILLSPQNIPQTVSDNGKDEITKTYPAGTQYLARAATKGGRKYSNPPARRGSGAGSLALRKGFSFVN